jgi:hypothetical protein
MTFLMLRRGLASRAAATSPGAFATKAKSFFLFRQDRQLAASLLYNFLNADYLNEIGVASRLFDGSLLTSRFFYEHILSAIYFFVFNRDRSDFDHNRLGAEITGHDPVAPFSNNQRYTDRLLLRW